jgi:uncharacterized membrane protein
MSEDNWPDESVLYEAVLRPHRSLSKPGFVIVMTVIAFTSFVAGMAFLMMGAWPVFFFFGLDVALVWWAFHVNYRAARAYETIRVTPSDLHVQQVSAKGASVESSYNPRWVRLIVDEDELSGVTRVALLSRGVPLIIGSFLPPVQKQELASALSRALVEARR